MSHHCSDLTIDNNYCDFHHSLVKFVFAILEKHEFTNIIMTHFCHSLTYELQRKTFRDQFANAGN